MGQQQTFQDGAIVWYRPTAGRGVVRLTGGKQYQFASVVDLDNPVANLKVRVKVSSETGRPVVVVHGLPGGVREMVEPPPPPPPKPKKTTRRKAATKTPAKKKAPARKSRATGKASKLKPKPDGSLPVGMSVRHETFGQGFIVMSSPKVARVKFEVDERSVKVKDLSILE
jgi:hypothetical protein